MAELGFDPGVRECEAGDEVHFPDEGEGFLGGVAVVSKDVIHDARVSAVFVIVGDDQVVFVERFPAVGSGPEVWMFAADICFEFEGAEDCHPLSDNYCWVSLI